MSEVSNDAIYGLLCDIKEDIGALAAKSDTHTTWMTKHVADDALMAADILEIKLAQAKSRGERRTWGLVATGAGSVFGALTGVLTNFLRH